MSRIKVLRANPRRLLAALATILVAVGVTVASGATFTAQTANAANTFTAGSLSMYNSKAPGAILTASGMKPGDAPPTPGHRRDQEHRLAEGDFTLITQLADRHPGVAGDLDPDQPVDHRLRRRPDLRRHQRGRRREQVQRHAVRHELEHRARHLGRRTSSTTTSSSRRSRLAAPATPYQGASATAAFQLGRRVGTLTAPTDSLIA